MVRDLTEWSHGSGSTQASGIRGPTLLLLQVRETYVRLMSIDPLRRGYYQDALDGKAFVVVKALGGV